MCLFIYNLPLFGFLDDLNKKSQFGDQPYVKRMKLEELSEDEEAITLEKRKATTFHETPGNRFALS